MMTAEQILARRDALAAQLQAAVMQYDQLKQTLKQLDRQLCAMQGGLQELDALLTEDAAPREMEERISSYATGLNPIHEASLSCQAPELER